MCPVINAPKAGYNLRNLFTCCKFAWEKGKCGKFLIKWCLLNTVPKKPLLLEKTVIVDLGESLPKNLRSVRTTSSIGLYQTSASQGTDLTFVDEASL